jgi:hypothetical protein
MQKIPTSLRTRIQRATTVGEVESMLAEGKAYLRASDKTNRQWAKATSKRIANIGKKDETKD